MKKILFILLCAVELASCGQKQPVVYLNGVEAVAVEFQPNYAGAGWQKRYMPFEDAQGFVDSVKAIKYNIVVDGILISRK